MKEPTEQLFKRHYRRMYLLAKALLHDSDTAKDVVNDVFADILYGKLAVRPETAESLLLVCVRNRCLNILNREKVRDKIQNLMMCEEECSGEPAERIADKLEQVMDYIDNSLTPQTSRIIKMRYRQKMTYAEIASALQISEAAVYKHLAQGIKQLKKQFNP